MNFLDVDGGETSSPHGRPCVGCRKRKVKCDKTRPCSNCARSKQLCTYESLDAKSSAHTDTFSTKPSSDGDVRERLERLEKFMAAMMTRGVATGNPTSADATNFHPLPPQNQPLGGQDRAISALASSSAHPSPLRLPQLNAQPSPPSTACKQGAPVGQVVFQDSFSAYYDAELWPGLVFEIEDLRLAFDASNTGGDLFPWMSLPTPGLQLPSNHDLSLAHPTIAESDLLLKFFFDSVNPFVRILHEPHFAKELGQYRRGSYKFPREFEAQLFAIYTLTANSLRPEIVQRAFAASKETLLGRFQQAAQIALQRVHFYKSYNTTTLSALLHYLTFIFQQNSFGDAIAMVGVAARVSQTVGFHRDPGHFPFNPWVVELRRRGWNHLVCLDAHALSCYGAESCLPATSDARPPQHANDSDWQLGRFAKPSSVPTNSVGFNDTTFVLVHREISDMLREISKLPCDAFESKENVLRQVATSINEKYLDGIDPSNPSQTVVAAFAEIKFLAKRLSLRHYQTLKPQGQASDHSKSQGFSIFIAAIELLEALEYHSTTFAPLNWEWLFDNIVPWLAIAIVLTHLPRATRQTDIDRAKKQVEIQFQRNSNASIPVSSTPLWRHLEQLRQQIERPLQQDQTGSQPGLMQSETCLSLLDGSELIFDQEMMMGFNASAAQVYSSVYTNQPGVEGIDPPWANPQMPF